MNPDLKALQNKVTELENQIKSLGSLLKSHQHTISDGTSVLRKSIHLDVDQLFSIGPAQMISQVNSTGVGTTDFKSLSISVGSDSVTLPAQYKSSNLQLNLIHFEKDSNKYSYLTCARSPQVAPYENTSISVSSGGNTVTITGYDFVTNELTGAYINIFNSSGTLIETRKISSNTATVITITGTWGASTSGGKFSIYTPTFIGKTDSIFRRLYVDEGTTDGGVRFGPGATGNGQNGLLYMDSAGDIYWRNKAGASTKLN